MFSSCSWVSDGVQCHHHVRPLLPGEDNRRHLHKPLCGLQLQPDQPLPGAWRRVPVRRRGQRRPRLPHADVRCHDPPPGPRGVGGGRISWVPCAPVPMLSSLPPPRGGQGQHWAGDCCRSRALCSALLSRELERSPPVCLAGGLSEAAAEAGTCPALCRPCRRSRAIAVGVTVRPAC